MSVLFVCLGNICRSPLAEGILRKHAEANGIDMEIDSAGTGNWHEGELPDSRAIQVGEALGCRMTMRARQITDADFAHFDMIIAMDHANIRTLAGWPNAIPEKLFLARSFDPTADGLEVPDPYYGNLGHFREVAAMLTKCVPGILAKHREWKAK